MTAAPNEHTTRDEVQRQLQELKDEEIVNFIRDTVVRLEVLADRLDTLANREEGGDGAGEHSQPSD